MPNNSLIYSVTTNRLLILLHIVIQIKNKIFGVVASRKTWLVLHFQELRKAFSLSVSAFKKNIRKLEVLITYIDGIVQITMIRLFDQVMTYRVGLRDTSKEWRVKWPLYHTLRPFES